MPITLSVQTYNNEALPQPLARQFDQLGGALGRAVGNDLVLDDPSKYISRVHARVEYRDGAYYLIDVGSNPSVVNERPLGQGKQVRLADQDRLLVGQYALIVSLVPEASAAPLPPSPLQAAAAPAYAPALPADVAFSLDDSLSGASILDIGGGLGQPGFDPLGLDLFAPQPKADDAPGFRGAESDHISPELQAFAMPALAPAPAYAAAAYPPPAYPAPAYAAPAAPAASAPAYAPPAAPQQHASMAIPDDYDPLADYLPPRVVTAPPPPPPPPPPAPVFVAPVPPQPQPSSPPSEDLETLYTKPEAPPAAVHVPVPAPATVAAPAPAPAAAPFQQARPTPVAQDDAVMRALLRGMGLSKLKTTRSAEEVAELAGAMLREATGGTMSVLMARAMTKRESRLEMTMIAAQANNPLKFFPDVDSALAQMLGGTMAGYMPALRAFPNAYDDLRAHELAMMAGMRAALAGVLKRFDPDAIEQRLQVPTVMDKMMASNRKAKMWERLVELYQDMSREADDDFQRLFGETFGQAYEEQIERLRQARR